MKRILFQLKGKKLFLTEAKWRTRKVALTEMNGVKLQKSLISCRCRYVDIDRKNSLYIFSGKESKW